MNARCRRDNGARINVSIVASGLMTINRPSANQRPGASRSMSASMAPTTSTTANSPNRSSCSLKPRTARAM
jgi:hypothetical protein